MKKIGVGVVGASVANPGWAVAAHLPAIAVHPDFELRAVATSRVETATQAAEAYGVKGYGDIDALVADRAIDLVVVAVKVPLHRPLIVPALEAGKMVLSEWPLGLTLSEAEGLAELARVKGVRTAIGLQSRYSPVLAKAAELVQAGHIGAVTGSTLSISGMAWGGVTDTAHAYMFDQAQGATTLTVPLMHALDAAQVVLGELSEVSALSAIMRPEVRLADSGEVRAVTAPDHVSLGARLNSGALISVHVRGATSRAGNLRWEINGTDGDLLIIADNGNIQVADLQLRSGRGTDDGLITVPIPIAVNGGMGANVARLYRALARDIRDGSHEVPDFAAAVGHHRLLAAIEASLQSGNVQRLA